jgi:tetratricopeptide (TPR) repeat protein
MQNLPATSFKIVWLDEYDLKNLYVSSNPTESRFIGFHRKAPIYKEPTSMYVYLIEELEAPEIALQRYDSDIIRNPRNPYAHYNRAILKHEVLGDTIAAQKDLNIALRLEPSLLLSFESRAQMKEKIGSCADGCSLIKFTNRDRYSWINYEKIHYYFAAEADISSPAMQYVFERELMRR